MSGAHFYSHLSPASREGVLASSPEIAASQYCNRTTLGVFEVGSTWGVVMYDQVEKIRAYVLGSDKFFKISEFSHPFSDLDFSSPDQLEAFKASMGADHYFRLCRLGKDHFKVYLYPKIKNDVLTPEQTEEYIANGHNFHAAGEDLYSQKKYEEALEHFNKCLAIQERLVPGTLETAKSYESIALVYASQSKFQSALELMRKSIAIKEKLIPNSASIADAYNHIGSIYTHLSNTSEALKYHEKSLVIYTHLAPESLDVASCNNYIGLALKSQGEVLESFVYFLKCASIEELLSPNSIRLANSYIHLGEGLKLQKMEKEALHILRAAYTILESKLEPHDPTLYSLAMDLASMAQDLSKWKEALNFADKAIQQAPQNAYAYMIKWTASNNIGLALKSKGKTLESLEYFRMCASIEEPLFPNSIRLANSYIHLAEVLKLQKMDEKALHTLRAAYTILESKLEPHDPTLYSLEIDLASTALALSKWKEALNFANKAIQQAAQNASAYVIKGIASDNIGESAEALMALEKALAIDPENKEALSYCQKLIAELVKEAKDFQVQKKEDDSKGSSMLEYAEQKEKEPEEAGDLQMQQEINLKETSIFSQKNFDDLMYGP